MHGSFKSSPASPVLDLASGCAISLGGLNVLLKLLQQSSLKSPSGQSLFLVVFLVGEI